MADTTTLNIQIDSDINRQASEVLAEMGLSISEAVNLLLRQVLQQRELPFKITTQRQSHRPTKRALAAIESIENGTAEMAGPFDNLEDAFAWLHADVDEEDD